MLYRGWKFVPLGLLAVAQLNFLCITLLSSHLEGEHNGASWETIYTRRAQDAPSELDNSLTDDGTTSILPKRLIAVFGMESSGSTFTATAIGIAAGVQSPDDKEPLHFRSTDSERNIEVQHISLPTGYGPHGDICMKPVTGVPTMDMPVLLPAPCMVVPPRYKDEQFARKILLAESPFPEACRAEAGVDDFVVYPTRFFINVTSHIQWYRERGVEATAVIMMRDSSISQISKVRSRCPHKKVAEQQSEHARQLMREAIDKLDPSNEIVLVSYEGIMSLRESYLYDIYRQLGINSTYTPSFKDGNAKYIDASTKVQTRLFPSKLTTHFSRVIAPVMRQNTTSTSLRLLNTVMNKGSDLKQKPSRHDLLSGEQEEEITEG
jgi:hypothetical protein